MTIGAGGDCKIMHATAASPALKPIPAIATLVPMGPPVGVRVIVGTFVVTVKVALAVSLAAEPVTVMVYTPGTAEVATVNPLVVN
jgi:hypothetical protein